MWPTSKPNDAGPSKDDLHQWSMYRQNLNAALTNSSSSNDAPSNGQDLTLNQETVDNILASKNYTPSDADHYLKYGLPRVKSIADAELQLTGHVRNQIKLFNEKQQNASSARKLKADENAFNAQNLSLNDDLNYSLDVKEESRRSKQSSKNPSKQSSKQSSKNSSKQSIKNSNKSSNRNASKNQSSPGGSSSPVEVRPDRLAAGIQAKQWKSNPNLQHQDIDLYSVSESCLSKQFRQLNKQSLSAYDVRNGPLAERRTELPSVEDRLAQFRKYQNETKLSKLNMNHHLKSDTDSLTKSLSKSTPCDELDFRKSSLIDVSFGEHSKYAKQGPQSSDSEFVLSLESKSQISKTKQPHLIVNKIYHEFDATSNLSLLCGGPRQKIRVLDNVSFEAKAGDMLALIATNPLESSQILDIMMNQHSRRRSRTFTEFYLNGHLTNEAKLSRSCAYVGPTSNLCTQMSTRQTILFFNLLQSTNREKNFDSKKRIDALIEELGLSGLEHTCVDNLNESEKMRVQLAIALLLETDILLLDQPIRQMDIFDSYFIIDYIRQYTLISGKIAILALHPPSYETLSLFTKVSLISTGRTVYFGDQSKMNVYFTYASYPCPMYKSPADYYLDLITVDHLSSNAILESNHRIESLIQLYQKSGKKFKRRKPSNSSTNLMLPADQRRRSFVIDFLSLWIRAMIFCFPYNIINLAKRLLLAVSLSLVCGCIFFKMRLGKEQEDVWDRFGFYHALLGVFAIPVYLHEIKAIHEEKKHVLEELRLKFYSKHAYFLSYLIYTLPGSTLVFLGYILPASSIAIQKPDLFYYIVIMLCYLHLIRLIAIAFSWCFSTKVRSTVAFGLVYFVLIMISGNNLHRKNINIVSRLVQNLSVYTWTYQSMINWEFDNSLNNSTSTTNNLHRLMNQRFLCTHNPFVEHRNAIIAKAECGIQKREHIETYLNMNNYFINWLQPSVLYLSYSSVILFIWYLVLCVLTTNNSHLLQTQLKESASFRKRCCKHEYL